MSESTTMDNSITHKDNQFPSCNCNMSYKYFTRTGICTNCKLMCEQKALGESSINKEIPEIKEGNCKLCNIVGPLDAEGFGLHFCEVD